MSNNVNALNEMSLAALYSIWLISRSPLYPILVKMQNFDSFNAFLGSAADSVIDDFIPDLAYKDDQVPDVTDPKFSE